MAIESYNAIGKRYYNSVAHLVKSRRFKCLNICFDIFFFLNYLSFRPKKCEKKTNNTTKYCISKWKFHLYHLKLTKRNRKRENSTLFMFGRIYFVTLWKVLNRENPFI